MNFKLELKRFMSILISKTLGTLSFVRIIEWREMLTVLKPRYGEVTLDVACGSGKLSTVIARKGCLVHGIDYSADDIMKARLITKNIPCDFVVGNAEYLPYIDVCFDKIVCSSALEHFGNDTRALNQMNRVLKEDGIVILTIDSLSYPIEPSLKEKHRIQYHVISYYNLEEISNKLEGSGFNILSSKYIFSSPLTSLFYDLYIKTNNYFYRNLLLLFVGDILIPMLVTSDRLFGKKNCGYTLLIAAQKKPTL